MLAPENPPGFVVRAEAQKAAWDNGYRLEQGLSEGWLRYVCALRLKAELAADTVRTRDAKRLRAAIPRSITH